MYDLNPAHHRWATDPTGPHTLLVPVESAEAFSTNLLLLTPDQRMRVERYTVREGDTVTNVAQRFGTTAQHLRELNELGNASAIKVGAELRVPSAVATLPPQVLQAAARVDARNRSASVSAVHVVRRGDTLSGIAKQHSMSVATLARLNNINPNGTLRTGQKLKLHADDGGGVTTSGDGKRVTYVVRRGDTLSGIARSLRVSVSNLREWNKLTGTSIRAGQKLVAFVPGRS
jgi:membrane-bound lytic murein transglycosylase D